MATKDKYLKIMCNLALNLEYYILQHIWKDIIL